MDGAGHRRKYQRCSLLSQLDSDSTAENCLDGKLSELCPIPRFVVSDALIPNVFCKFVSIE